MPVALGEDSEGVDETGIDEVLEALALLVGEALLAAVGLGVGEIQLGMRDIQVAAEDHGLLLLQQLAVGKEGRVPVLVAQCQPAEVFLGIGGIHRDDMEISVFRRDHAAFVGAVAFQFVGKLVAVGERLRESVGDFQRLLLGEDRGARVALFHRGVPVLVVAGQVDFDLPAFGLGFLQAQDVRLVLGQEGLEGALPQHGANAVDVPGIDFHAVSPG